MRYFRVHFKSMCLPAYREDVLVWKAAEIARLGGKIIAIRRYSKYPHQVCLVAEFKRKNKKRRA